MTDRHVLLKKLMVVLESLKGHMMGQNKDEVEEAISMVGIPYSCLYPFLFLSNHHV